MVLHDHRGRRHGRATDRAYGDRGAVPVDPRPLGELPAQPLVRTVDNDEKWWCCGHASLVEAPDESWWSIYHGYENGFWTLGRQALLDPIEWTADGWFRMKGGDLSAPIAKPKGGQALPHGQPLSDGFKTLALGGKWNFFKPGPKESARARVENGALILTASGAAPADSSPLAADRGRSGLSVRMRYRDRAGRYGGAGPVL